MMTGNLIYMIKSLPSGMWSDVAFFAASLLSYFAGSWLYHGLDLLLDHRSSASANALVVLLLTVAPDVAQHIIGPERWQVWSVCVAMGVVTSITSEVDGMVTNMMTGNMQKVANALFDYACRERLDTARTSLYARTKAPGQALTALYVVLAFVCGGLFGAFSATSRDGQYTLVLPAVLLCSVLLAHDLVHAPQLAARQAERRASLVERRRASLVERRRSRQSWVSGSGAPLESLGGGSV
jgi:uncharacterized membrane protein YoaK (UPF0700 family)